MYGNNKGILSLLEQFTNNKKGAVSNNEYKSFMDTDTGTDQHTLKNPTRNAGAMSDTEFNAYG